MMNRVTFLFHIPYFIEYIESIPYLSKMQNKKQKNARLSYSLFYKSDVTLGCQLRKLHASAGTEAVFTRITNCSSFLDDVAVGYLYLPRIRNKEYNFLSIPYSLFLI